MVHAGFLWGKYFLHSGLLSPWFLTLLLLRFWHFHQFLVLFSISSRCFSLDVEVCHPLILLFPVNAGSPSLICLSCCGEQIVKICFASQWLILVFSMISETILDSALKWLLVFGSLGMLCFWCFPFLAGTHFGVNFYAPMFSFIYEEQLCFPVLAGAHSGVNFGVNSTPMYSLIYLRNNCTGIMFCLYFWYKYNYCFFRPEKKKLSSRQIFCGWQSIEKL